MKVTITTTGIDSAVRSMLRLQNPQTRRSAIAAGANEAEVVVQAYYQNRGRNLWTNGTGPKHGPGRKGLLDNLIEGME